MEKGVWGEAPTEKPTHFPNDLDSLYYPPMVTKLRDQYQAYYTKSDIIVRHMVNLLQIESGMKILEPCGGDGIFVEAILERCAALQIDVYEIDWEAIEILRGKFASTPEINIIHEDVLLSDQLEFFANKGGEYDRVIANPPYGAWQNYEKRDLLKQLYNGFYVKETYSLFLYRCLQLLRDRGILVFIIPDTFLSLHRHTKLRRYMLDTAKILSIDLFPSSFFPGVNFGYSGLSIIALQKCLDFKERQENIINVSKGFKDVSNLGDLKAEIQSFTLSQHEVCSNQDHAFLISQDKEITIAISQSQYTVGDLATCVTGFYSGNDKAYLRTTSRSAKNSASYKLVSNDQINTEELSDSEMLLGINHDRYFIPILKGGNVQFFKPHIWFMDWNVEAVELYKSDRKARFQNSQYYFKYGIGVPMVSSKQITAAVIENCLFDQSIVGIFPNQPDLMLYLLAFFNTPTCNKIIRTINPSANNSANYIKKIPIILPEDRVIEHINNVTNKIVADLKQNKTFEVEMLMEIQTLIKGVYGF